MYNFACAVKSQTNYFCNRLIFVHFYSAMCAYAMGMFYLLLYLIASSMEYNLLSKHR